MRHMADGQPTDQDDDLVAVHVGESAAGGQRESRRERVGGERESRGNAQPDELNPTTSTPEPGEGDMQIIANAEGFEFMVFLPQLVMRLCPPLMLLQLIPDFRPRADHVLFSLGVSTAVAGIFKSTMVGSGALATLMACPAVLRLSFSPWCRAAGACVPQPGQREGYGKPHKMKVVGFAIGLLVIFWSIHDDNGESLKTTQGCEDAPWACFAAIVGVMTAMVVVMVWAIWAGHWAVCRDWSRGQIAGEFRTKVSTWSKPQLSFLSGLFVERFPLGELQISDDGVKRCLSGSRWREASTKEEVKIALDTRLYKKEQLVRFKEICSETDTRWGELRPTRVQKVVNVGVPKVGVDGPTWALDWERYDEKQHEQLHLQVKYDADEMRILLRKATAHRPAGSTPDGTDRLEWKHQGGAYTTGYRVAGPANQVGEGDYINSLTSSSNQEPGRLEFTQQSMEQLSKRKLVHVNISSEQRWVIATPSVRTTISSGGMGYDSDKFTTQFEAEQVRDEPWTVTGPPSGVNAEWIRPSGSSLSMKEDTIGLSRAASPDQHEQQPEPEPELEMSLKVHGFVRAEYEIVFPRRLDLTFQTFLGATVRASDHVEFQILQIENFLWSSFQLLAIMVMMQVYAINTQEFVARSGDTTQNSFWTNTEFWVDPWHILSASETNRSWETDWVNRTFIFADNATGMRLAESEVLLPALMYVFVCFVGASEHAMFSGMDTLSESREDRWYRRAEKSWRESQKASSHCSCSNTCEKRRGHFVAAGCCLLVGAILLISVSIIHADDDKSLTRHAMGIFAAVLLAVAMLVLAAAFDAAQHAKDGFYRILLKLFLFCTDRVCTDDQEKESRTFEWFRRHISSTDLYLRTSFRLDKRDEMRKHELSLTYIEAPMWSEYREAGPDGFKEHFNSIDDAVIYSDLKEKRERMKVFQMSRPSESNRSGDGSEIVRTNSKRRFLSGTTVFQEGLSERHKTVLADEDTCMSVGHIADMIIYLSKARRLVHARRTTLICLSVSVMHAAVPFWHAWLPKTLGGKCGTSGCVWYCPDSGFLGIPFDAGRLLACSESLEHVYFHVLCAIVNITLTYAILNRLFKCQADYYARYCHMLYFIQLTPWSNLQHRHLKDHWGLLPTFDLASPGNVEAWNKLRLYLQSAQIKSSRFKQVSVLWCFFAVVLIAIVKIIEMVIVESQKVADADCGKYFEHDPEDQCNQLNGCQWTPAAVQVNATGSDTVLPSVVVTSDGDEYTCAKNAELGDDQFDTNSCHAIVCEDILAERNCTLDATSQWCSWNLGHQQCEREEQHFDTMSLFVVVETLIFGFGLIYTLWEGMKSNEIKREAFPYVIRMKYSELLSNSMNFVSERAHWEKHKRSWRAAEVKLLSIVRKLENVKNAATNATAADEVAAAMPGTIREQVQAQLTKKSKDSAIEKLEEQGFYSFVSSDSRESADRGVYASLAAQLQQTNVVTSQEEADRYTADLINEGCTTFQLLKDLVKVNTIGSDAGMGRDTSASSFAQMESNGDGPGRVPELSVARYPFGSAPNHDFPNPATVNFDRLLDDRLDLRPSAAKIDSTTQQSETMNLTAQLAAARKELEAKDLALHNINVQMGFEAERKRCMRMLKVLADTLDDEYSEGGRAHWGSEDRRTKMWFINLNRPLLGKLILAIFGQVMVAAVGILLKYLAGEDS